MWLLVDVENVKDAGFTGAEWLTPEDSLVIFYSAYCDRIRRGIMETVENSGCYLDSIMLENTGKNALDFYIVSYVAELANNNPCDEITVISKDRGFQAVLDYWKRRRPNLKIHFQPDILRALYHEYKPGIRRDNLHRAMENIPLASSVLKIRRRNWLMQELTIRLDPDTDIDIWSLSEELQTMVPGKAAYLSLMHHFGIPDGLIIYQAVKALNNIEEMKAG